VADAPEELAAAKIPVAVTYRVLCFCKQAFSEGRGPGGGAARYPNADLAVGT
jgi:hypothetical protein